MPLDSRLYKLYGLQCTGIRARRTESERDERSEIQLASEAENRADLADRQRELPASPFDSTPRGRLLSAMAATVVHGGYREATVDRVLEHAHVGWEEFARQFDDLDACFLATLDVTFECAAAAAEAAPEAPLDAMLERLLGVVASHPDLARLCLVESAALGARALESKERGLQRFVVLIERRLHDGTGGRDSASALAAEMVVGGIYEVLQRKVRAGGLGDPDVLAAELRQLWLPVARASSDPDTEPHS